MYIAVSGCAIDLVLILDDSGSIGFQGGRQDVLDFASAIVNALDVGPNGARVGLIQFSDNARNEFFLDTYTMKSQIISEIQALQSLGGKMMMLVSAVQSL